MINENNIKKNDSHFSSNDSENVTISDCLGVVIIEIDNKWKE
jgi:hypothetical protein